MSTLSLLLLTLHAPSPCPTCPSSLGFVLCGPEQQLRLGRDFELPVACNIKPFVYRLLPLHHLPTSQAGPPSADLSSLIFLHVFRFVFASPTPPHPQPRSSTVSRLIGHSAHIQYYHGAGILAGTMVAVAAALGSLPPQTYLLNTYHLAPGPMKGMGTEHLQFSFLSPHPSLPISVEGTSLKLI